jgi:hypothetical protein
MRVNQKNVRKSESGRRNQKASALTTSPPALVAMAHQTV